MAAITMKDFESHQKKLCIVAIVFASIGLLLLCVGIGTSSWHIDYNTAGTSILWYTNYFYTCYAVNGSCWSNQYLASVVDYYSQPITQSPAVSTDYYLRLRNAAALGIIGLLFVLFGLIATVFLMIPSWHIVKFGGRSNLIAALLLAIAALFQRAALSEGQHQFSQNGYSASLYDTGHVLTIFTAAICAFVAGRIYF
ncbi:unnamed protein product [Rotaria sordida]|uniref:Uncharacterized protein n=1 Tax=Rotaria sordida TaxID=392033 RepID=A0A819S6P1_9BILA|nr:unnamed protein product [Rotaria sordida]CAF0942307.1 unnamed protein product [Rotaria sordida]CAF0995040.1 unnamed protein product [Rotaria sordida]CAF1003512.1 unnamed protein product [Rotaria sordida]CAF1095240.1 unnamed protein product [Rotaria sordida]